MLLRAHQSEPRGTDTVGDVRGRCGGGRVSRASCTGLVADAVLVLPCNTGLAQPPAPQRVPLDADTRGCGGRPGGRLRVRRAGCARPVVRRGFLERVGGARGAGPVRERRSRRAQTLVGRLGPRERGRVAVTREDISVNAETAHGALAAGAGVGLGIAASAAAARVHRVLARIVLDAAAADVHGLHDDLGHVRPAVCAGVQSHGSVRQWYNLFHNKSA
eukprot:3319911-Rhodomonas_salina.2